MDCPKCGVKMSADLEIEGGCDGSCGEYCYCPSKDVVVTFVCMSRLCKGYNRVKVSDMSDQDSIARWLTEHYEPGPDTKIY